LSHPKTRHLILPPPAALAAAVSFLLPPATLLDSCFPTPPCRDTSAAPSGTTYYKTAARFILPHTRRRVIQFKTWHAHHLLACATTSTVDAAFTFFCTGSSPLPVPVPALRHFGHALWCCGSRTDRWVPLWMMVTYFYYTASPSPAFCPLFFCFFTYACIYHPSCLSLVTAVPSNACTPSRQHFFYVTFCACLLHYAFCAFALSCTIRAATLPAMPILTHTLPCAFGHGLWMPRLWIPVLGWFPPGSSLCLSGALLYILANLLPFAHTAVGPLRAALRCNPAASHSVSAITLRSIRTVVSPDALLPFPTPHCPRLLPFPRCHAGLRHVLRRIYLVPTVTIPPRQLLDLLDFMYRAMHFPGGSLYLHCLNGYCALLFIWLPPTGLVAYNSPTAWRTQHLHLISCQFAHHHSIRFHSPAWDRQRLCRFRHACHFTPSNTRH